MVEQSLYKIVPVTSNLAAEEDEGIFDCCLCGKVEEEDLAPEGGFVTTVEVARVFNQMKDATTEEEMHAPLQKIYKYAASFAGTQQAQTEFLKDIAQLRGIKTILGAIKSCINDAAVVMRGTKALRELMGSHDDMLDDWEQKRTALSEIRATLITQFLSANGLEITTRAFGIHAIKYDPYEEDTQLALYRTDLRFLTMQCIYITVSSASADKAAKLVQFFSRVIPKMLPPHDTVNESVMHEAFLCILKCLEVKGVQKQLKKEDILDVVSVSVATEKVCKSQRVAGAVRAVWSWAGAFSSI